MKTTYEEQFPSLKDKNKSLNEVYKRAVWKAITEDKRELNINIDSLNESCYLEKDIIGW